MLGVSRKKNFDVISVPIHEAFVNAGDMYEISESYIVGLLERGQYTCYLSVFRTHLKTGVRVLVYVGTNDLACNFVGNYRTVQGLDWSGGNAFSKLPLDRWSVNGHVAGETKTYGRLTFATVRGAGHLVSPWAFVRERISQICRYLLTSRSRRRIW